MPPAARITDMHVCPMVTGVVPHVGGPVAVGMPTVLIGMMPAARVGDMCVCVGPPDTIAKGSPTVLIGGMMAARMGDMTMHGGNIVLGFPTVLIGDGGAGMAGAAITGQPTDPCACCAKNPPTTWPEKKARLEQQQQLIEKFKNDPVNGDLANRMASDLHALELAKLSGNSYSQFDPKAVDKTPPLGWTALSKDDVEKRGMSWDALQDSKAVVYQTPPDYPGGPQTVVAFRGTTPGADDILTDYDQAMGHPTRQYEAAGEVGYQASKAFPGAEMTGHSLGGGKAQAAAASGGQKGMGFNAAGLHPNSVGGAMPKQEQFEQYRTEGDPLTGLQNSKTAQAAVYAGAGGAAIFLPGPAAIPAELAVGDATVNIIEHGYVVPPAIGTIHEVPAIGKDGEPLSKLNPQQHGIDNLIRGLEKDIGDECEALCHA